MSEGRGNNRLNPSGNVKSVAEPLETMEYNVSQDLRQELGYQLTILAYTLVCFDGSPHQEIMGATHVLDLLITCEI